MNTYSTDRDITDMVTHALEAGFGIEDFDIDGIVGDMIAAADFDGKAFTNLPEGDDFWDIVQRHDSTQE